MKKSRLKMLTWLPTQRSASESICEAGARGSGSPEKTRGIRWRRTNTGKPA